MKLMHKMITVATLVAGLGTAAAVWAAGPGNGPGPGTCDGAGPQGAASMPHHGKMGGMGGMERGADPQRMAERHQQHQEQLKAKLKLTGAQEGAWKTFTTAMQPPANRPDMQAQREAMSKLSTPERMDKMQEFKAQRDAEQAKRADAVKAFYAQLSPEQKKVFDTETARGPKGEGPGHHGDHMGGRMMDGPRCGAASQPK